jgi:hypothetical protein
MFCALNECDSDPKKLVFLTKIDDYKRKKTKKSVTQTND